MARRCGCASDSCSCVVVAGDGIQVNGTGSERNPYVITSEVSQIETGIDIQVNNSTIISDVHGIDFRGTGVTVAPGVDEVVVTIPGASGGTGTTIPAGLVSMYGGNTAPTGWLFCDGATLLIADQPALFAAIGTLYGGDGTTTFRLPSLMDRSPIGASATKPLASTGGSATKTIGAANMPPHNHDISHTHAAANTTSAGTHDHAVKLSNSTGGSNTVAKGSGTWFLATGPVDGDGNHFHAVGIPTFNGVSGAAGSGVALDIMPPWLALGFIIKT